MLNKNCSILVKRGTEEATTEIEKKKPRLEVSVMYRISSITVYDIFPQWA